MLAAGAAQMQRPSGKGEMRKIPCRTVAQPFLQAGPMAMKVIDQANVVPQTGLEPVTPSLRMI